MAITPKTKPWDIELNPSVTLRNVFLKKSEKFSDTSQKVTAHILMTVTMETGDEILLTTFDTECITRDHVFEKPIEKGIYDALDVFARESFDAYVARDMSFEDTASETDFMWNAFKVATTVTFVINFNSKESHNKFKLKHGTS